MYHFFPYRLLSELAIYSEIIPSFGISAFISLLIVAEERKTATGRVLARIIPRTTVSTEPGESNWMLVLATAFSVTWSTASLISATFISFGEIHGMSPPQ